VTSLKLRESFHRFLRVVSDASETGVAVSPLNFAVTGVGGSVVPRPLHAIAVTGNRVVAAVDPHDAVGLLMLACR